MWYYIKKIQYIRYYKVHIVKYDMHRNFNIPQYIKMYTVIVPICFSQYHTLSKIIISKILIFSITINMVYQHFGISDPL